MKKIVLPPTEGGYYMFGELPQMIAEARHSDDMYRRDVYLSAIVWRDDGTEHGQFFKCTPPPELPADGIASLDGWTVTPVTEEGEAEDLDAGRWRSLRKRAENSDRLSDGSLLILAEKTQRGVIQQLSIMEESKWYTDRMREDARRGLDDPRRLCVVDGNLNSLTFTHGAALDRGWVHIDKLNQWGATLDTVNVFSVGEVRQEAATEQQAGQNDARKAEPLQRSRAQDTAILEAIAGQGYDPKSLPANESGKSGVKAAIRERVSKTHPSLFIRGSRVFDKAWDRLRALKEIKNKDEAA